MVQAESTGSLLPGVWRDSLHVTCGLTALHRGSAPGLTLGNEYGRTFIFFTIPLHLLIKLAPIITDTATITTTTTTTRWQFGLTLTRWSPSTSYSTPGPVNTWMGDSLRAGTPSRYVTSDQVNSAFHPSGVGKLSTCLRAGIKAERIHLCRVAGNTV